MNLSLSGKKIEGGGHFEMITNRFCVEAKYVVGIVFKRTKTSECAVYSVFLIINILYFRFIPSI